jgi:hypothetical protein
MDWWTLIPWKGKCGFDPGVFDGFDLAALCAAPPEITLFVCYGAT